jgi:hypothetical protein
MFFNYTVFRYPPLQRESERNSPHSTPNDSRLVLITIRAAKNSAFHIRSTRTFRAACDNQKLTHNSESGESSAPRYVFTRIYRLPLKLACTGYKIAHELFFQIANFTALSSLGPRSNFIDKKAGLHFLLCRPNRCSRSFVLIALFF